MNELFRTTWIQKTGAVISGLLLLVVLAAPTMAYAQGETGQEGNPTPAAEGDGPKAPVTETPTEEDEGVAPAPVTGSGGGQEVNCQGALCGVAAGVLQVVSMIVWLLFSFVNFLLWLSGVFLNGVLNYTVFQFGANFGNSEGVLVAWGVLRDIGNIFLLFSFVFMGVATILNIHDYAVKKALPRLLIFAVLLNFSLFVTEVVIDVANGLSTAISTQSTASVECGAPPAGFNGTAAEYCTRAYGITGSVMDSSRASTMMSYSPPLFESFELNQAIKTLMTLLGLTLFSATLAFVFLAVGIMLIIRVIVLLIIMVTSPIGFAGSAVPFMSSIAAKWWGALINQALFAPVFLLLVFIGLKIIDSSPLADAGRQNSITDAFAYGDISFTDIFVTFAVSVGFVIAAVLIAKRFGAMGANFATETAGKLVFGTAAGLTRMTLGRSLQFGANSLRRSGLADNEVARHVVNLLDKGATSSWDGRGGALGKGLGGMAGWGGASGGAAHGVHGIDEERLAARKKYAGSLQTEREFELEALEMQERKVKKQISKALDKGDTGRASDLGAKLGGIEAKINNHPLKRAKNINEDLKVANEALSVSAEALKDAAAALAAREADATAARATGNVAQIAAAEAQLRAAQASERAAKDTFNSNKEVVRQHTEALDEMQNRYADHLGQLADFFISSRANREAQIQLVTEAARGTNEKNFYKMLEAVKGLKASDSHGANGHPDVAPIWGSFGGGGGGGGGGAAH